MFFTIVADAFSMESEYELEFNFLPQQIHENDQVLLEIYTTVKGQVLLEIPFPIKIESLDSSIIDIVDLNETHDYKSLITLKANGEGETFLYVFSEGLSPLEIPVTVHGNNSPKYLSLDIFPDTLDIFENNQGVLSLLMTDKNGFPVIADEDYFIRLDTSKPGIISLSESNMIISKGSSGAKQMFNVVTSGIVTVSAKTNDLTSSGLLTVEEAPDETIELSIIPDTISSSNTGNGHIIAQLFSEGKLTKAIEDITVFFEITSSSDSESLNTSLDIDALNPTGYFQIKKGTSYGNDLFSIPKSESDTYSITATSQSLLIETDEVIETMDVELYDDEEIKFEVLPVLSDGSRQLIGVVYLEDAHGHPVTANRDIVIPFTTDNSISIETAIIKKGFESSLVFGNVGFFIPSNTDIALNIQNSEVLDLDVHGSDENSVSLQTHVFTDHFLKGEQHWVALYMDSPNGLFSIPNNQKFEFSESEVFLVNEDDIEYYPYFTLIPITAIDLGDDDLVFGSNKFETSVSLSSVSLKPDSLHMDSSDTLFTGIKDTFVIQILDSSGLPVRTNDPIEIKIFSSDSSIIDFPKSITIPQESNFISLDLVPLSSGLVEISLVSEELPIFTKEILVQEITPTLQITSTDIVEEGGSFIVSILAKQNGIPLQNVPIIWELNGGFSTIIDEKTGPTGEAIASIISTSNDTVKVSASIDGGPIQSAFASKIVKVNATMALFDDSEPSNSFNKPDMGGFDPVLLMVPLLIVGIVFYMKKKSK